MKTRSGGHDFEGLSYTSYTNQPFVIVDIFNLRSIHIGMEHETAWVQSSATLGELYYRIADKSNTHAFPAGICPTVGVGGHFSGGGYGGGGVSFGVVLSYKIKLVRVPPVVTVVNIKRVKNLSYIAHRWLQVADKLYDKLFLRMMFRVVNNGERTIQAEFPSLYLGNSTNLVTLFKKDFPELGLEKSEFIEMSWIESVLYDGSFPIGTPTTALLNRKPQYLIPLKIKSDYVKTLISQQNFELIFEKMKELENQQLHFNPYGGQMSEISEFSKPFPHRSGNTAKVQYVVIWEELGVEAEIRYLNFTRVMYDYMTPFVSKNPREAFLNYRDLDIGVNSHGKNACAEGMVYGHKYFRKSNYKRLTMVKSRVDPENFFRNEQSIPPCSSNDESLFVAHSVI
ncbi:hypothetical protein LXL04_032726 [Taraxacum kok-saghyz]